MMVVLNKIQAKINNDPAAVTLTSLTSAMISLHEAFPAEFKLFGLLRLLPKLAEPTTEALAGSWEPLVNPAMILDICADWLRLVRYFQGSSNNSDSNTENENMNTSATATGEDVGLAGQTRQLMHEVVERHCLHKVRTQIATSWRYVL